MQARQNVAEWPKATLAWPLPPFLCLAVPLVESRAWACRIELLNGNTIVGNLQSFESHRRDISLTTSDHQGPHHLNRPEFKIWTAEDPVEISQPGLP